jgi:hypothetical protein
MTSNEVQNASANTIEFERNYTDKGKENILKNENYDR